MEKRITCSCIVPGNAEGPLMVSSQTISFWGGIDPASSAICDRRHELFGQPVAGSVLAFPMGKGSSTSSLIFLELVRIKKAPAAMINIICEPILATGPIVAKYFYHSTVPVITMDESSFQTLETGQYSVIRAAHEHAVCIVRSSGA